MIKLTALLKFPKLEKGRTNPISDNYRPLFKFGKTYVTGSILLKKNTVIFPGDEANVEIYIYSDNLIGKISKGQIITYWEPPIKIGEICVLDYLILD